MTDRYARHPGRSGFTEDQLLDKLRELYAEGVNPSTRDCDAGRYGLPSRKVFARLFGSLDNAKEQAGVPVISGQTSAHIKKSRTPGASDVFEQKVARGHL